MNLFEILSVITIGAAAYKRINYEIERYLGLEKPDRVKHILYGPYSLDDQAKFEVIQDEGRFVYVNDHSDSYLFKTGLDNDYGWDEEDEEDEDWEDEDEEEYEPRSAFSTRLERIRSQLSLSDMMIDYVADLRYNRNRR